MGKAPPCGADDGKPESGAKIFKAKCATCHTCNDGGPNKQGPNLFGVIGRQSGQVRSTPSSAVMMSSRRRADARPRTHDAPPLDTA